MNAPIQLRPLTLRVADLTDTIDRARIGAYVHEHPDATPFHLPAWSAAVARGCGQRSHYLIAERGEFGIVGVMPLTELHSPLFGRVLASAGFGVGGGILADKPAVAEALARECWTLAQQLSCPSVEVRGGPRPGPEWTVDDSHYLGFVRPLSEDDDAELLAIPRKQRAEVRKALETDLDISIGRDPADVAAHYAVYAESVRNLGTPVFPRALFTEVLQEFGSAADVLVVRREDRPVSAVLSLYWRRTVFPYWGGGTAEARRLRANDRMYFELMRHARERGCTRFDFGRSKVGTGAAAFKKNWGFEPQPLTYYDRVADGAAIRDANPLNPKYRLQVAVWSKLPLAIANRVGPLDLAGARLMGDVLFLAHRVPFPPDRGDKIRAFNIIRYLSERKRVHLVAFADDPADLKRKSGLAKLTGNRQIVWRSKPQALAGVQSLVSHRPVSLTAFDNAEVHRAVESMLARHAIDTIYVFSSQMAQYVPLRPRQKVIMDFVDMDSAKFASYGETSRGFTGWMMRREARLLGAHEKAIAARADASLFVSEEEAQLFQQRTGAERVHAVGNGIDTGIFDPGAQFKRIDTMGELIVFTGQMDYRPNIEGVTWFVETILPHIHLRHPNARFAIVGRKPTEAVKALAKHKGVVVTGEVADVRPWLHAASVVVAPLKLARGIQNKVLEAMAMARPVVASGAAATGIDHGGTIEVGETVGEIADAVNRILADPLTGSAFGALARQRVIDHYSWDARLSVLDDIMGLRGRNERRLERPAAA